MYLAERKFVHFADRLITILCETALASMDTSEVVVTTPEGNKYQGVELEDEDKFIGVVITKDSRLECPLLAYRRSDINRAGTADTLQCLATLLRFDIPC